MLRTWMHLQQNNSLRRKQSSQKRPAFPGLPRSRKIRACKSNKSQRLQIRFAVYRCQEGTERKTRMRTMGCTCPDCTQCTEKIRQLRRFPGRTRHKMWPHRQQRSQESKPDTPDNRNPCIYCRHYSFQVDKRNTDRRHN